MCLKLASGAAQSRPACHVLCTLLSYRLVEPVQVSRCIDLMTSGESLNQPALVCDSSIGFWLLCYQTLNASQAGGSALLMHQEIISWITNKWSPSEYLKVSRCVCKLIQIKATSRTVHMRHKPAECCPCTLCSERFCLPSSHCQVKYPVSPASISLAKRGFNSIIITS